MQGRPQSIEIEYAGDLGVTDLYPLTSAMLVGYLSPTVENVNTISAPTQLEARGIECTEKRSASGSYYAVEIGITVVTDEETSTVKGTLFQNSDPRICSIGGMRVDAEPKGHMLICTNEDVPQVLGKVCTSIGEAGVNIANLTLGRAGKGGKALTLVNLDQALSAGDLEKLAAIDHVTQARLVALPE